MNDFLQSREWREFQTSVGRETFFVEDENFETSIVEHKLPIIGKYFYVPRGIYFKKNIDSGEIKIFLERVCDLARKNGVGWIRLDIDNEKTLASLKDGSSFQIIKAPHDTQPKEVFIININKSEDVLLAEMKSKTRYNIRLAEKKGILIKSYSYENRDNKYFSDFLRLTKIMAKRQGITPHPDVYYQKMFEQIPVGILKLYIAEYQGKIVATDLIVFYKKTATYLHGASDDEYRNVMAPHLLKWREILDAKKAGCNKFDFGGIKLESKNNNWQGITRFKLGFSQNTEPTKYLGSYDLVLNPPKYFLYRLIQKIK